MQISYTGGGRFNVYAKTSGVGILSTGNPNSNLISPKTWHHVLMSFDLSNVSKKHIYVDGVDLTSEFPWLIYDTS